MSLGWALAVALATTAVAVITGDALYMLLRKKHGHTDTCRPTLADLHLEEGEVQL
jgi:predicted nucleic acid-binding protein